MLPILLNLGPIKIYTFGVFLLLSFFWGSYLLWKNIRLTQYKEDEIFDGLFLSLMAGMISGRLVYIVLNFRDFGFNLLKYILINGYPGFSFYGCLAGGLLFTFVYFASKKINFREIVDYFVPPMFVALGISKIGAFFSGVEVGTKTKFPLSISYVGFDGLRHLPAFYEGILFIAASYIAYNFLFMIRRGKFYEGFLLVFFFWYVSLTYTVFDLIKANQTMLFGYSFNQIVSVILLLTFSFYFLYYFRSSLFKAVGRITSSILKHGKNRIKAVNKRTAK